MFLFVLERSNEISFFSEASFDITMQSFNLENHKESVQAFMRRYGITAQAPRVEYLTRILHAFAHFPYENISKIIKVNKYFHSEERLRQPQEIIAEHLRYGLGGTCFSLTWYLQIILLQNDFWCYPVIAHMRNRPREHCALVVVTDKRAYLVDPGYLLHEPMLIDPDQARLYHTEHTGVELVFDRRTEYYHLYTIQRQEKKWRYCFQNRPVSAERFRKYWLESFYRRTMHGLCLTRVNEKGMIYLHNDYLQISTPEGKQKQRIGTDLSRRIQELFGIDPQWVEQALEKLPQNLELEKRSGLFTSKGGKKK